MREYLFIGMVFVFYFPDLVCYAFFLVESEFEVPDTQLDMGL